MPTRGAGQGGLPGAFFYPAFTPSLLPSSHRVWPLPTGCLLGDLPLHWGTFSPPFIAPQGRFREQGMCLGRTLGAQEGLSKPLRAAVGPSLSGGDTRVPCSKVWPEIAKNASPAGHLQKSHSPSPARDLSFGGTVHRILPEASGVIPVRHPEGQHLPLRGTLVRAVHPSAQKQE